MARYILRFLDGRGALRSWVAQEYANDIAVLDSVEDTDHPYAIEIWQGRRLVAELPALAPEHEWRTLH